MSEEIVPSKQTVETAGAKRFIDLIEQGVSQQEAAAQVGMSLAALKRRGALGLAVEQAIERAKQEKLLEKDTEEKVARVRRLELMLQDEDLKTAAQMVKSTLDVKPGVAIQINNNALLADPAVRESLESLQIDIEAEDSEK